MTHSYLMERVSKEAVRLNQDEATWQQSTTEATRVQFANYVTERQ